MKIFLLSGAILGFCGVVLGAFAAHLLKSKLSPELFAVFEVGVRYHMYHALALLAVGWAAGQFPGTNFQIAGYSFLAGIIIFSGSLYVMALTDQRWLGMITPVGGLCFLCGWAWFAWGVWKSL
jgi:uncharacterized membrane protein YgdD (TMEM256/DUF423 family)